MIPLCNEADRVAARAWRALLLRLPKV